MKMLQLSSSRTVKVELEVPADVTYVFPDLMDAVRHAVKESGIPLKVIADRIGEKDETALSRKLSANEKDNTNFPLKKLPALIEALGDKGQLIGQWLVMTYLVGQEQKQAQAAKMAAQIVPVLAQVLKDFGYRVEKA